MKGFNFKSYLEKITKSHFNGYSGEMMFSDEDSLKTEFGDNYEDILLAKMSEEQALESEGR